MFRRLALLYAWLLLPVLAVLVVSARLDILAPVIGGALLGVLPSLWIVRRVVKRLQNLTASAERIASGDFDVHVYGAGKQELGGLTLAFNQMSRSLAMLFSQLEADRQQLRAILSGMVEGVIALDSDQRVLFANDRAAELLDFKTEAVVGRMLWEVFRQRGLQDLLGKALTGAAPCEEELSWTGTSPRTLMVHAARLPGIGSRRAILVFHDVTELRRLERMRQEFVANVSHELKTPLAVIRACAETLVDGAVEDREHRLGFLEQIGEQAERLNALILDLLVLNRIESGAEVLEFEAVSVADVVRKCIGRHRARAEGKRQTLAMQVAEPNGMPLHVWADEEAVEQVIDNLLDNAVKYTPEGGKVNVRFWTDRGDIGIAVEDNGIGIADRDLPRVFERFYRVDKARSRELGGTGLGLSIVKHLVQAMRGRVEAKSELGEGTTFTFYLPHASGGEAL